jgi:hypothetical protein
MKVRDLVRRLKLCNQDAEVIVSDSEGQYLSLADNITEETAYTEDTTYLEPLSLNAYSSKNPEPVSVVVIWKP